jgi:leader peptidase (prepilin peptidase)/N-methyltransferase
MIAIPVFLFFLGAVLGSFWAAASWRFPRGERLNGRSRCPRCGQEIAPRDNIPILGWVMLRGRSRCCQNPISLRYPLIELSTALLLPGLYLLIGGIPMIFLVTILLAATIAYSEIYLGRQD